MGIELTAEERAMLLKKEQNKNGTPTAKRGVAKTGTNESDLQILKKLQSEAKTTLAEPVSPPPTTAAVIPTKAPIKPIADPEAQSYETAGQRKKRLMLERINKVSIAPNPESQLKSPSKPYVAPTEKDRGDVEFSGDTKQKYIDQIESPDAKAAVDELLFENKKIDVELRNIRQQFENYKSINTNPQPTQWGSTSTDVKTKQYEDQIESLEAVKKKNLEIIKTPTRLMAHLSQIEKDFSKGKGILEGSSKYIEQKKPAIFAIVADQENQKDIGYIKEYDKLQKLWETRDSYSYLAARETDPDKKKKLLDNRAKVDDRMEAPSMNLKMMEKERNAIIDKNVEHYKEKYAEASAGGYGKDMGYYKRLIQSSNAARQNVFDEQGKPIIKQQVSQAKELVKANAEDILKFGNMIPVDASPQKTLELYLSALMHRKETLDKMLYTPTTTVGNLAFGAVSVLHLSEGQEQRKKDIRMIQLLAPIVLANRMSERFIADKQQSTEKGWLKKAIGNAEIFAETSGDIAFGMNDQYHAQQTQTQAAGTMQEAVNESGVQLGDAGKIMDARAEMRNYSAADIGQMIGPSAGLIPAFITGAAVEKATVSLVKFAGLASRSETLATIGAIPEILENAGKTGKISNAFGQEVKLGGLFADIDESTKLSKAIGKVRQSLVKGTAKAVREGITYEFTGISHAGNAQVRDEAEFWSGFLAVPGKSLANAFLSKSKILIPSSIQKMFGTNASKVMDFIGNRIGSGIGESGEETGQTLWQLYRDSPNYEEFSKQYSQQFGHWNDKLHFFASTMIMGMGMGEGSELGKSMVKSSLASYQQLDEVDKEIADKFVNRFEMLSWMNDKAKNIANVKKMSTTEIVKFRDQTKDQKLILKGNKNADPAVKTALDEELKAYNEELIARDKSRTEARENVAVNASMEETVAHFTPKIEAAKAKLEEVKTKGDQTELAKAQAEYDGLVNVFEQEKTKATEFGKIQQAKIDSQKEAKKKEEEELKQKIKADLEAAKAKAEAFETPESKVKYSEMSKKGKEVIANEKEIVDLREEIHQLGSQATAENRSVFEAKAKELQDQLEEKVTAGIAMDKEFDALKKEYESLKIKADKNGNPFRQIQAKFKGKVIYATPASGKSHFKKELEGSGQFVVDTDEILLEKMQASPLVQAFAKAQGKVITNATIARLSRDMHNDAVNRNEIFIIYKAVGEEAHSLAKQGATVLTGSRKLQSGAHIILTKNHPKEISRDGVAADRDNPFIGDFNESEAANMLRNETNELTKGTGQEVIQVGKNEYVGDILTRKTLKDTIDEAAAQTNPSPTEAQKKAGNYKKGSFTLFGMKIFIETAKGVTRAGVDKDGKAWSVTMNNHYGFIAKTEGRDGDEIDVFMGENPTSENVFVIDQVNEDGAFDEHKVMLGFDTAEQAKAAYMSNFSEGWKGFGGITATDVTTFQEWIATDTKKSKPFFEYAISKIKVPEFIAAPTIVSNAPFSNTKTAIPVDERITELERQRANEIYAETFGKGGNLKEILEWNINAKYDKELAQLLITIKLEKIAEHHEEAFHAAMRSMRSEMSITFLGANSKTFAAFYHGAVTIGAKLMIKGNKLYYNTEEAIKMIHELLAKAGKEFEKYNTKTLQDIILEYVDHQYINFIADIIAQNALVGNGNTAAAEFDNWMEFPTQYLAGQKVPIEFWDAAKPDSSREKILALMKRHRSVILNTADNMKYKYSEKFKLIRTTREQGGETGAQKSERERAIYRTFFKQIKGKGFEEVERYIFNMCKSESMSFACKNEAAWKTEVARLEAAANEVLAKDPNNNAAKMQLKLFEKMQDETLLGFSRFVSMHNFYNNMHLVPAHAIQFNMVSGKNQKSRFAITNINQEDRIRELGNKISDTIKHFTYHDIEKGIHIENDWKKALSTYLLSVEQELRKGNNDDKWAEIFETITGIEASEWKMLFAADKSYANKGYTGSDGVFRPTISPFIIAKFQKEYVHGNMDDIKGYFINDKVKDTSGPARDSFVTQLVNVSVGHNKIAFNYAGVDGKRKTSFEQSSDLMRSFLDILLPGKFLDSNPIAQMYRKANKTVEVYKFAGMFNTFMGKKMDVSKMIDNDLAVMAMIEFANVVDTGGFTNEAGEAQLTYLQPVGQFGDKDQIYMARVQYYADAEAKYMQYLEEHPEEVSYLSRVGFDADGKALEIERAIQVYKTVLSGAMAHVGDFGAMVSGGRINEAELRNYVFNYALNKIYMDEVVHGNVNSYMKTDKKTDERYFDLTDLIKRAGSTNSPGYTGNMHIEGGIGWKNAPVNSDIVIGYQGTNESIDTRNNNYYSTSETEAKSYGSNVRKITVNMKNFLRKGHLVNGKYEYTEEYQKLTTEFKTITGKHFDILDNGPEGLKIQDDFFNFLKTKGYNGYTELIKGLNQDENKYFVTFDDTSEVPEGTLNEEVKTETFTHVVLNTASLPKYMEDLAKQLDGVQIMSRAWADRLAISMGSLYANLKSETNEHGVEEQLSSVKAIFSDKDRETGMRGLTKSNVVCIDELVKLFPGSVGEQINEYMKEHNIDTLSFKESTKKVEGNEKELMTNAVSITENEKKFVIDKNVKPNIIERKCDHFFIQQDLRHSIDPHSQKQPSQGIANALSLFNTEKVTKLWNDIQNKYLVDFKSQWNTKTPEAKRRWLLEKINPETMHEVYMHLENYGSVDDIRYAGAIRGIIAKEIKKEALVRNVSRTAMQELPMGLFEDLAEYRRANLDGTPLPTVTVANMSFAKAKVAFAKGEGIWTMRPNKDVLMPANQHYGNPWSPAKSQLTPGTIVVPDDGTAARNYADWLNGIAFQDVQPERLKWINAQINSGALDHKKLIYYNSGSYYSHADALAKIIKERRTPDTDHSMMKFPQVDINLEGIRYQTGPFKNKEAAIAAIKANITDYQDMFIIDDEGHFTDKISEAELIRKGSEYYIPGSIVIYARIPADDLHSHTVARARKRLVASNFIVTDRKSQLIAGADFDGDKRYVESPFMHKGKDGKVKIDMREESKHSKSNRAMYLFAKDYQNPNNETRVTRPIDLDKYNDTAANLREQWSRKNSTKGASKGGRLNDPIAISDARNQNNVGNRVISIMAKLSTAFEYSKKVGFVLKENKITIPRIQTSDNKEYYDSLTENASHLTGFVEDKYGVIKNHIGILLNLALDNAKDPKIEMMGLNEITANMFAFALMTNRGLDKDANGRYYTEAEQEQEVIKFIDNIAAVMNTPLYQAFIDYSRSKQQVSQDNFTNETVNEALHAFGNADNLITGEKTYGKHGEVISADAQNLIDWNNASQNLNAIGGLIDSSRETTGDTSEYLTDYDTAKSVVKNQLQYIDTEKVYLPGTKTVHPLFEIAIRNIITTKQTIFEKDILQKGSGVQLLDEIMKTLFKTDKNGNTFNSKDSLKAVTRSINEAFVLSAIGTRKSLKLIGTQLMFALNAIGKENNAFVNMLDFTDWDDIKLTRMFSKSTLTPEEMANVAEAFNNLPDQMNIYKNPNPASKSLMDSFTREPETNGVPNELRGTIDVKQMLVTYIIGMKGISTSTWNGNYLAYVSNDFFDKINTLIERKQDEWINSNAIPEELEHIKRMVVNKHGSLAKTDVEKQIFFKGSGFSNKNGTSSNKDLQRFDIGEITTAMRNALKSAQNYIAGLAGSLIDNANDWINAYIEAEEWKKANGHNTYATDKDIYNLKFVRNEYAAAVEKGYKLEFSEYLAERISKDEMLEPEIHYMLSGDAAGEMLASGNPQLREFIREHLMESYPGVHLFETKEAFQKFIEEHYGYEGDFDMQALGAVFKGAMFIDPEKAVQSTFFHEHAHLYWDALPANHPIKKRMLKRFGGDMEACIIAIGRAGVTLAEEKMNSDSMYGFPAMLKEFWAAVKELLNIQNAEDLAMGFAVKIWDNKDALALDNFQTDEVRTMVPDQSNPNVDGYDDKRKTFFNAAGQIMSSATKLIKGMQNNAFNPTIAAANKIEAEQSLLKFQHDNEVAQYNSNPQKYPAPKTFPYSEEEKQQRIADLISEWDDSAKDGSLVHQIAEYVGRNQEIPQSIKDKFAPGVLSKLIYDLKLWEERTKPKNAVSHSEVKISDENYMVGGIIDRVWDENGIQTVVDFKTSKHSKYDATGALVPEYTANMSIGLKREFQTIVSTVHGVIKKRNVVLSKRLMHDLQLNIYARLLESKKDAAGHSNIVTKMLIVPIKYEINDDGLISAVAIEKPIEFKRTKEKNDYIKFIFEYNIALHSVTTKLNRNLPPLAHNINKEAREDQYKAVIDLIHYIGQTDTKDDFRHMALLNITVSDVFSILKFNGESIPQVLESKGVSEEDYAIMPLSTRLRYLLSPEDYIPNYKEKIDPDTGEITKEIEEYYGADPIQYAKTNNMSPSDPIIIQYTNDQNELKVIYQKIQERVVPGHATQDHDPVNRLFDMSEETLRYFEQQLRRLNPVLTTPLLGTINALLAAHVIAQTVKEENSAFFNGYKLATVMLSHLLSKDNPGEMYQDLVNVPSWMEWSASLINDRMIGSKHEQLQYLTSEIRKKNALVQLNHVETDEMMHLYQKCDQSILTREEEGIMKFANPYEANFNRNSPEFKFLDFYYRRYIQQDQETRYSISKDKPIALLSLPVPRDYMGRGEAFVQALGVAWATKSVRSMFYGDAGAAWWYNRLFKPAPYDSVFLSLNINGQNKIMKFGEYKMTFDFAVDEISDMKKAKKAAKDAYEQQAKNKTGLHRAPSVHITGNPNAKIRWASVKNQNVISTHLNTLSRKYYLESMYPMLQFIHAKYSEFKKDTTTNWINNFGGKMIFGKSLNSKYHGPAWNFGEKVIKGLITLTAYISLSANVKAALVNFGIGQTNNLMHLGFADWLAGWKRMGAVSFRLGDLEQSMKYAKKMKFGKAIGESFHVDFKAVEIMKKLNIVDVTNEHSFDKTTSNSLKKMFMTLAFGMTELVENLNQGVVIASQLGNKWHAFDSQGNLKTAAEYVAADTRVQDMIVRGVETGVIANKLYKDELNQERDMVIQAGGVNIINTDVMNQITAEVLLELEVAVKDGKLADPDNLMTDGKNPFFYNAKNKTDEARFKGFAIVSAQDKNDLENISRMIHGDYGIKNSGPASFNVGGQALMQFKRWLPAMFLAHFANGYVDSNGREQRGTLITLTELIWTLSYVHIFKHFSEEGTIKTRTALKKELAATGTTMTKDEIRKEVEKIKQQNAKEAKEKFDKLPLHEKMKAWDRLRIAAQNNPAKAQKVFDNMSATDKANLIKLTYQAMMLLVTILVKAMQPEDKDKKDLNAWEQTGWVLFNQMAQDMVYVVNPMSWVKLFGNLVPIMNTAANIGYLGYYVVDYLNLYTTSPEYRSWTENGGKADLNAWREHISSDAVYKSSGNTDYSRWEIGDPKLFKYVFKVMPFGSFTKQTLKLKSDLDDDENKGTAVKAKQLKLDMPGDTNKPPKGFEMPKTDVFPR